MRAASKPDVARCQRLRVDDRNHRADLSVVGPICSRVRQMIGNDQMTSVRGYAGCDWLAHDGHASDLLACVHRENGNVMIELVAHVESSAVRRKDRIQRAIAHGNGHPDLSGSCIQRNNRTLRSVASYEETRCIGTEYQARWFARHVDASHDPIARRIDPGDLHRIDACNKCGATVLRHRQRAGTDIRTGRAGKGCR